MAASPLPQQPHLLIIYPTPEPAGLLKHISEKTNLRINWVEALFAVPDKTIYKDVDILATIVCLPASRGEAPQLRYIHALSAGTDHLSQNPLFSDPSIRWTSSGGIHGPAMAEWVFLHYLASERQYDRWRAEQRAKRWTYDGSIDAARGGRDMLGQRLGVMGYGSIGRQVARVAAAMGMEVLAFTATEKATPEARRDQGYLIPGTGDPEGKIPKEWFHGLDKESVHRFLAQDLDLLVVSVPLTEQTRGFLGKEEFQVLAKHSSRGGAFLSNIARGDVIVQDDLITALNTKGSGIRGAALDVVSPEPLPAESPLWDAPNCQITPHNSSQNSQYIWRALEILHLNLQKPWEEKWINQVDQKKGY